jgi:hypothetical protein
MLLWQTYASQQQLHLSLHNDLLMTLSAVGHQHPHKQSALAFSTTSCPSLLAAPNILGVDVTENALTTMFTQLCAASLI